MRARQARRQQIGPHGLGWATWPSSWRSTSSSGAVAPAQGQREALGEDAGTSTALADDALRAAPPPPPPP
eukprot:CAMPEP_0183356042 /NCGR_PEP_ID=MMETSP0164_2-20130417/42834_1 /TAXON_ID=221442 /ORGANISM="Coccolithus pelagicus ssp braarudi, Strain PLY182g" /LENGTH=69 /DNA_ID=CAMNT_0025529329 /DNA_START=157 /DNA_END=363 /DNA_ORIENTATION=+